MPDDLLTKPAPATDPTAALADSQDSQQEPLKEALQKLVSEHVMGDIDREKVFQYQQARKHELYWRGNQYIYPILLGGQTVDWTSTGTLQYNLSPDERDQGYDYVLNIIRGDGLKFIAVLGQRGPNVKAQPRRLDDDASVRRSRKADLAASYLRSIWEPERIQRHLAMSLWKNGTTFAYTPWVSDKDKYGEASEPIIDFREVPVGSPYFHCIFCGATTDEALAAPSSPPPPPGPPPPGPGPGPGQPPGPPGGPPGMGGPPGPGMPAAGTGPQCSVCAKPFTPSDLRQPNTTQVPFASGLKYYPRGTVECELATVFEVTLPFYVKNLRQAPWLWYEYEEHQGKLLKAFPSLRTQLGSEEFAGSDTNSGISSQGQLARDVASSPTGAYITPRKNRWLYQRFWVKPIMYELIKADPLRTLLQTKYPSGVKITMVQGKIVDLQSERLEEVWSMCKPSTSEYIFADPICKDYMGIQDIINDLYNLVVETLERSIPFMLADPLVLDVVQMSKQRGRPGQIVPAKAGVGQSLQNSIYKAPTATVDPQVINWISTVHESGRELVGVLPAIFGGEAPDNTARAAEMRRNQALQQLNPVWNEMRDFWSATYLNGVRQLAKYSMPDGLNLGSPEGGQWEDGETDFTDLSSGGWYFTTEEAMPMTWGAKRDMIMFMLQSGPEAWKLFGMEHPLNVDEIQEALGLPNWTVPNLDAYEKVMSLIQQLKQGTPLPPQPGPPDPMTGMPGPPGPPQPSIAPDGFEDDHMLVVSIIKGWAQKEEARALKDKNPDGYQNIIAYAMASMALLGPPPGPPGPGGPGGPAPGGPVNPGGPPLPGSDPNAPAGLATAPPSGGALPGGHGPNG